MDLMKPEQILYEEISEMIEQSRRVIYSRANAETVLLFWRIGQRVNSEVLNHKRADYGKQIVVTLSRQLTEKYGRSYDEKICEVCLAFKVLGSISNTPACVNSCLCENKLNFLRILSLESMQC